MLANLFNDAAGRKRLVLFLIFLPALLYAIFSPPIFWPVYQCMLFRPICEKAQTQKDQITIESCFHSHLSEITFPSANGAVIHARYFELPGATRVFIASEGKGGNMYRRLNHAEFLLQCGGSVLQYDYQGFGESGGSPSLEGVCQDAEAAYAYLTKEKHVRPENIIAYGESFGTGVTGQLAARKKLAAVVLHSGFTSLLRAARDTFPLLYIYPDFLFPRQHFDNVAVFSKTHPPLLILHGGHDDTLSVDNATDLYRLSIEPKKLLTESKDGHVYFSYKMRDDVVSFLTEHGL